MNGSYASARNWEQKCGQLQGKLCFVEEVCGPFGRGGGRKATDGNHAGTAALNLSEEIVAIVLFIGIHNHPVRLAGGIREELRQVIEVCDFRPDVDVLQQLNNGLPQHSIGDHHDDAAIGGSFGRESGCGGNFASEDIFGSGQRGEWRATCAKLIQMVGNSSRSGSDGGTGACGPELVSAGLGAAERPFAADNSAKEQSSDELLDEQLRVFVAPGAKDDCQIRQSLITLESRHDLLQGVEVSQPAIRAVRLQPRDHREEDRSAADGDDCRLRAAVRAGGSSRDG